MENGQIRIGMHESLSEGPAIGVCLIQDKINEDLKY